MSRKKMKRTSSKPKAKKTAARWTSNLAQAETMEKDFRALPSKLVAHYQKELLGTQQLEKKLMQDLKKAQAQNKLAKNKQTTLASKSTATAKKQLAAAKKDYTHSNSAISLLTKQLHQAQKMLDSLGQKKNMFAVLGKELLKLQKNLGKKAIKTAKKRKAAVRNMHKDMVIQTPNPMETNTQTKESPAVREQHEDLEYQS